MNANNFYLLSLLFGILWLYIGIFQPKLFWYSRKKMSIGIWERGISILLALFIIIVFLYMLVK